MKIKFLMLISLLLMIAGIVVSSWLFIRLQERNAELKKAYAERDSAYAQLELAKDELEFRVEENDAAVGNKKIEILKDSLETISKVATEKVTPVLIQREKTLRTKLEYANYFVGIYSLGVPSEKFDNTVNYLNAKGYSIVTQVELDAKPAWLANASTVFYYDAATRSLAQNLANDIGAITRTRLRVQQGAGLGVPEGMRGQYLYVHLVGAGQQRTTE